MIATPRLDEEEQRTWRLFAAALRRLRCQLDRDLQRDAGMPTTYYELLQLLAEAPERARRMSDLAEATRSIPSRISHAVGQLEQAGWVRRELCSHDRRGWFAVLTDAGAAALEAAAPGHEESLRRNLFDRLSPAQVAELRGIAEALLSEHPGRGEGGC